VEFSSTGNWFKLSRPFAPFNPDSAVEPPNFQGQCGILEERRRPTLKFQKNFAASAAVTDTLN
jgi:hypothetical protein